MAHPLTFLWSGLATISEYQDVTDPITFQTKHQLVPVVTDEPCRISFASSPSSSVDSGVGTVTQTIKLFIRNDLEVSSGSVIEVTQNGVTKKYRRSGENAVYSAHQEINLVLYEENT